MTRIVVQLAGIGAFLIGTGTATSEEKKEPSAKSREAAKVLKENVGKLGLSITGFVGKKDVPVFSATTDKDATARRRSKEILVISEDEIKAVIDVLVNTGQFDKPKYIPPAGFPAPGWYLSIGSTDPASRIGHQWVLGGKDHDLTTDTLVSEIIKVLKGDAKKALQILAKETAK